jgi:S1-C subfamily serine protease
MGVEILPAGQVGQSNVATPATTSGVTIEGVISGGPAASTALVPGDVITAVNGHSVTTTVGLGTILQALKPGDTVQVSYVNQSDASESLSLQLGSGPAQ